MSKGGTIMNCPICGDDMEATGGVPTIWLCKTCTKANKGNHKKHPEAYFKGDTIATIEVL